MIQPTCDCDHPGVIDCQAPPERYCGHCKTETSQEVHDSGHELDGSGDWQRCLECGYTYYGLTGRWHAPAASVAQINAQVKQVERDVGR
jgi:hypothetical protein